MLYKRPPAKRPASSSLPELLGGSAALTLSAVVGALAALRVGLLVHVLPPAPAGLVEEVEVDHDVLKGTSKRLARRVLSVRHLGSE